MASQANFTGQQIADVIRAGLRQGPQPARMSVGRAAERAATHRNILTRYREHAQQSLDAGDYLQAAEKSWGAYAQTVKAIGADHRLRVADHTSIVGVGSELASLVSASDAVRGYVLAVGLAFAQSLHQHFYENNLSDRMVITSSDAVGTSIDLLQELFPPELNAS